MALPAYQASGTQVQGTGAILPTWPSHITNDLGVILVQTANEAVVFSDAQGFVELSGTTGLGTAGQVNANRLSVFWRMAGSSNESTPTIADAGDHAIARMFTVRSAYTLGTPLAVVASDIETSITSNVTIPAGTTPVNECFLALCVANAIDNSASQLGALTNATIDNIVEVFDGNTNNGVGGGVCFNRASLMTAGAFGVTTGSLATGGTQVRMVLAVYPTNAVFPGPPSPATDRRWIRPLGVSSVTVESLPVNLIGVWAP